MRPICMMKCDACGEDKPEHQIGYQSDIVHVCTECVRKAMVHPERNPKEVFLVSRMVRKDRWSPYRYADRDATDDDFDEIIAMSRDDFRLVWILTERHGR